MAQSDYMLKAAQFERFRDAIAPTPPPRDCIPFGVDGETSSPGLWKGDAIPFSLFHMRPAVKAGWICILLGYLTFWIFGFGLLVFSP